MTTRTLLIAHVVSAVLGTAALWWFVMPGAALEAIGHRVIPWGGTGTPGYSAQYDVLYRRFGASVCQEVFGFNDEGWTREQIADWLESKGL